LGRGKNFNYHERVAQMVTLPDRINFPDTVRRSLGGMQKADHPAAFQGGGDASEAGHCQPRLSGYCQSIKNGTFEQLAGKGRKIRWGSNVSLETAGEGLLFYGGFDCFAGPCNPYASAWKPGFEVRNGASVRANHEPDQFPNLADLAGGHTQAFWRTGIRPAVQLHAAWLGGVSGLCGHQAVRIPYS
jgi:hypothetical protein